MKLLWRVMYFCNFTRFSLLMFILHPLCDVLHIIISTCFWCTGCSKPSDIGLLTLMKRLWDSALFTGRRPPFHSVPISHSLSPLFIPLSFSFPFPKPLSLLSINKNGSPAWLSVPVKCNPKSTASSSTTILMVMGSILYQGYHILLEMTVSKVGVDAVGTKTGAAFCQSGAVGWVCLCLCVRDLRVECVCVGG